VRLSHTALSCSRIFPRPSSIVCSVSLDASKLIVSMSPTTPSCTDGLATCVAAAAVAQGANQTELKSPAAAGIVAVRNLQGRIATHLHLD
jgi:hypothetical protein